MEEEKKKRTSGYAILKAKLAKKEQEVNDLKDKVNTLKKENDVLTHEIGLEKSRSNQWQELYEEAVDNMGWIRRKIFGYSII